MHFDMMGDTINIESKSDFGDLFSSPDDDVDLEEVEKKIDHNNEYREDLEKSNDYNNFHMSQKRKKNKNYLTKLSESSDESSKNVYKNEDINDVLNKLSNIKSNSYQENFNFFENCHEFVQFDKSYDKCESIHIDSISKNIFGTFISPILLFAMKNQINDPSVCIDSWKKASDDEKIMFETQSKNISDKMKSVIKSKFNPYKDFFKTKKISPPLSSFYCQAYSFLRNKFMGEPDFTLYRKIKEFILES